MGCHTRARLSHVCRMKPSSVLLHARPPTLHSKHLDTKTIETELLAQLRRGARAALRKKMALVIAAAANATANDAADVDAADALACRYCACEADGDYGGVLLNDTCNCRGSMAHMHARCLAD